MYRTIELYNEWNETKKDIHFEIDEHAKKIESFYVNEREIRYVRLWLNVGFEENGKRGFIRPVLVIKKVWNLFFVIPMTTKIKSSHFYHRLQSVKFSRPSSLILSQARVIDKKRFEKILGEVDIAEFLQIKKLLKELYL
ncbi:MAG: hypothetical protein ACD_80C00212G0005 [uncultured bacterium (gcode 4)]|uniref:Uncharacterized protein n=1 Tax=uncultured bacterium (gcode 4) TaxID=1234023 RepID=K1XHE4_9BACT|nr:MAG: hypothetical protein ACD_80C00212G0005 [uncultured bacterium (gcode 4)]